MTAAALLWILVPLWRTKSAEGSDVAERRTSTVLVGVLVPALAIGLYAALSNWNWDPDARARAEIGAMSDALAQLEARLSQSPNDVDGWLLLGRSYTALGRFPESIKAHERAYELTNGSNVEAIVGLAEAMFLNDQSSLAGRAGELVEAALARAPNHPKALWYGAFTALQAGDLRTGRERLQLLLAQNPPEEVQAVLQRQIDDLTEQIGDASTQQAAQAAEGAGAQRSIEVNVTIAPEIQKQIDASVPLFVLARDPAGGPPLAVQRHSASAAPLTVRLTENDAMLATRTIASVPRVEVVARLSRSGSPQAQSGDFYGAVEYEFGKDSGTLNIIIDQVVP